MANCQHDRTTRSGSNAFIKQIKCQDCEKILFKWFIEAPIPVVALCLQDHFVPLVDLQNLQISLHSENETLVADNRALKADNRALTQQVQKVQKEHAANTDAHEELQAMVAAKVQLKHQINILQEANAVYCSKIVKLQQKLRKLKAQAPRHMENQKPNENLSASTSSSSEFEVIRPAKQNAFKTQAKVTSSDQ